MRGDCHSKLGMLDEAMEDLRRAVELDPEEKQGLIMLTTLLSEVGKFNEAIKGK